MFVSVYTIAKNEEDKAAKWYASFNEADEVVVLVNNTTDRTAEILRSLGAKVEERTYDEFRFDRARNDAMALCSRKADLFFAVDMDDFIQPGWRERLEKIWKEARKKIWTPKGLLYEYVITFKHGHQDTSTSFLRNWIHTPGWKWKGRIHEQLVYPSKAYLAYTRDLVLHSRQEFRDHSTYLKLLEDQVRDGETSPRNIHLLGREYMNAKRYAEAIPYLKKHLMMTESPRRFERGASMKFLADCYGMLGNRELKELWLWKAMDENPDDRDASFALGVILSENKEYHTAVSVWRKCLAVKERNIEYPSFCADAWTANPYFFLAEALFNIGRPDEAIAVAKEGLTLDENHKGGRELLADMERKKGNIKQPEDSNIKMVEIPRIS